MTSTSNGQHPPTSNADFNMQASHSSHLDSTTHPLPSGYASSDNHLAGLVEAATAAAGQDVSEWATAAATAAAAVGEQQHHLDGYGGEGHIEDDSLGNLGFVGSGRQLKGSGEHGQPTGLSRTVSKKRKRGDDPLDPALTGSGFGQPQQQHHYDGDSLDVRSAPSQSLSDARSVGLHSAAALFRQPSSNKKYTRPPMSKMFTSLELSPENFLHLQAAAKAYMLDDNHPERRDCVGQRGKGDTEMVKLRLWNCVKNFLEAEGNGERFFGEHVVNEDMGARTHIWPRDQQKIISLVIPLLRRMVTNERQRQYAIESRKGGGDERKRRKTDESIQAAHIGSPRRLSPEQHLQMQPQHLPEEFLPPQMAPVQPMGYGLTDLLMEGYPTDLTALNRSYDAYNHNYELDNLYSISGLQQPDWRGLVAAVDSHYQVVHNGDYHCSTPCEDENVRRIMDSNVAADLNWRVGSRLGHGKNEFATGITRDVSRIIRDNLAASQGLHPDQGPDYSHQPFNASSNLHANTTSPSHSISLHLNILQNGKRLLPRLDLSADSCPDLTTLKQHISRRFTTQFPSPSLDSCKFRVWLPDGLSTVQNDGEWTIALLNAGAVDWMDGDLRVLAELDGA